MCIRLNHVMVHRRDEHQDPVIYSDIPRLPEPCL
jgi:hypothetical protein